MPDVYLRSVAAVARVQGQTAIGPAISAKHRANLETALAELDLVLQELAEPQPEIFDPIKESLQRMLVALARTKIATQRHVDSWEACASAGDALAASAARQAVLFGNDPGMTALAHNAAAELAQATLIVANNVAQVADAEEWSNRESAARSYREGGELSEYRLAAASNDAAREFAERVSRRIRSARP